MRQELTEIEDGAVIVNEEVAAGNDVRYAGEDIRRGETILHAGTLLGSAEIGALAAVNIARPVVVRRPRIALVSTGDELVSPGPELEPGQIRDANAPALTAAAQAAGAEIVASMRVGDDRDVDDRHARRRAGGRGHRRHRRRRVGRPARPRPPGARGSSAPSRSSAA